MARRQPQGTGKGAGEVILLRELRCIRCGCRSTDGDGFDLADSMLLTIDHMFTSTTGEADTRGTVAAVCSVCVPHVEELLAGVAP